MQEKREKEERAAAERAAAERAAEEEFEAAERAAAEKVAAEAAAEEQVWPPFSLLQNIALVLLHPVSASQLAVAVRSYSYFVSPQVTD